MIAAVWRILRADFKSNKLQFGLIWGVLALSGMLLLVSILILSSTSEPWDRTFEETNGPHLWLVSHQYDLDYSPLVNNPEVTESSGVIMSLAENPIVFGDEKQDIFLYAMDERPPVAHPLIAEGRWLAPQNPMEIVLDYSFARFYDLSVGDTVEVLAADGLKELNVVGLAVTAHWFPFNEITKDVSPGVAYISQATLETIQPDPNYWYSVIGLRLKDPDMSSEFGEMAQTLLPGKLRSVLDWQFVKKNSLLADQLNGMFMGLFSVMGLAAVGLIIFNTIGGQVLSQYRTIGLLKAVGFEPRQVTLIFLCEMLFIGLTASLVGIALGLVVAPGMVGMLAENLNMPTPEIYSLGPLALVIFLVEGLVALVTLVPAVQGGGVDTVQAITVGYRMRHKRASRLAWLSAKLRLPPVVSMGVKDTFSRPVRTALAIASLLLTIMVAITATGAYSTMKALGDNRFYFNGTMADMKVGRNFVPVAEIEEKILSDPQVVDYYQESMLWGWLASKADQPVGVRILSGDYSSFDFQIKEGRMISGPGEVVLGFAVLNLIDAHVGDTVELLVDGDPLSVKVVGRYAENFNMDNMAITNRETYEQQTGRSLEAQTFNLRLKKPGDAEALRSQWLNRFGGEINVSVVSTEPQTSVTQLVDLIASIAGLLMLVAGANLLSTSLLSIRERVRDFGIQKTLGFTPGQIAGNVMVGAVLNALIAFALGITLGMFLMIQFIREVGISIGAGPDFYLIDWRGIGLLLPGLVLLALISSLAPAYKAAHLQVVEALRYE